MTVTGTVEDMVVMTMVVGTRDHQDAHHIEVVEVTPLVGHLMVVDQEGSGQDLFLILRI